MSPDVFERIAGGGDAIPHAGSLMGQYRPGDPPTVVPTPATGQGGAVPAQRPINSLAIVSLVAGIAGYVIPHPFIAGLVAIVTGHMARGQIRRTGEGGALLATVGLI